MPFEQGQVINERYRIVHLISQDQHGAIYRAWDLQNQSPCALKERLDADLVERERFSSEAVRLFKLTHPHLEHFYDYFAISGQGEYLVSEFVEGEDLRSYQEKSRQAGMARLAEAEVVPWLMQASDALVYLHRQAPPILHGEIKPANLRLTPQGEIVLVGLGFSQPAGPAISMGGARREVSPGYSAPEQYGAAPLDPRSDVFAMGAVLYTLLTGTTPPDSLEVMTGAASLAPARQFNPLISAEIDRLIQQSMQGNRNARLPDMRSFANALAAAYNRLIASPAIGAAAAGAGATVATGAAVSTTAANAPATSEAAADPPSPGQPERTEQKTIQILLFAIAGIALVCVIAVSLWFLLSDRGDSDQTSAIGTQSAQTLEAQITVYAAQTAAAQQTAPATEPPGTASPIPPTSTVTPEGPTPTRTACEKASFVSDVTVPDNTVMNPMTPFTKTWRIRNDSQCTWNSKYSLVFAGETQMSQQITVAFPGQVPPGQTVDLSVNMQAPSGPGAVQSNWLLRSPENVTFGVGANANNPLYARIWVTTPLQPDVRFAYDFTANACNAQWRTAAGVISCNNISSDPRGSALALANAPLERSQENEPGLWVRPDQNPNGFIVGEYPNYTINPGDHFVTEVGCAQGSTECNVSFQLDIQVVGGDLVNVGVWNEIYDGKTRIFDRDLAPWSGKTVRFLLRVVANGQAAQANAIWFLPSIRNQPVAPTATVPAIITPTTGGGTPYP